jgi:hypothetical protein
MVWKHSACSDHGTASQGQADDLCEGRRFQQRVIAVLSGIEVSSLPEAVRQLRAQAAGSTDPNDEPGDQVALLWDDPSRFPWGDAPATSAPM